MTIQDFLKAYQKKEVNSFKNSSVEKPLVSVSIVTYQHVNYIKECLDGILMQKTNFPFEILLGDDESTDGTREICLEYARKYPEKIRFFLHHRENNIKINGAPTGRFNFIYNLFTARGKYIALCEGDDYWTDPLKLQKQVDFLEENEGYEGCFHSTYIKDEINKIEEKLWRDYTKCVFTIEDTLSKLSLFHTSSFLFKRENLLIPKWFTSIVSGDMALFALIASNGLLYFINEPMSVYRKNEGGVTNSLSLINYHTSRIELFENLNKEFDFQYITTISAIISYHKNELKQCNESRLSHLIKRIQNKIK
ncbi:glycosyl transferase family 2 [Salegentibacter sp. 24]|uniref:glycosyltransferase family 2 protein n=1 Tax=Salegentibacter sp. 24 TaxID=2183986 RepID=UPI001061B71A|nr:glycosyltransferase [Salegentibacter sp. 24]TDN89146.1 glycosyl transferase family 2 [Salegentibacter sp. 24]